MDSTTVIPRYSLPHKGLSAASAYQLLHDELTLDGNQVRGGVADAAAGESG